MAIAQAPAAAAVAECHVRCAPRPHRPNSSVAWPRDSSCAKAVRTSKGCDNARRRADARRAQGRRPGRQGHRRRRSRVLPAGDLRALCEGRVPAGQYCTIGLEGIERPYSIVSSPHEPYLELFLERVPHGALTPRLWGLRLGDPVSLRPRPKGLHPPGAVPLAPHGGDGHGHRAVREHAALVAPSGRSALPLSCAAGRELPGRVRVPRGARGGGPRTAAPPHLRAEREPPGAALERWYSVRPERAAGPQPIPIIVCASYTDIAAPRTML